MSEPELLADQLLRQLRERDELASAKSAEEHARIVAARRERDEAALVRDAEARVRDRIRRAMASVPPKLRATIAAGATASPGWPASVAVDSWWRSGKPRVFVVRGGIGTGKSLAAGLGALAAATDAANGHREAMPAISWHRPNDFVSAILHAYADDAPALGNTLVVIDDVGRETKADFDEALCTFLDDFDARLLMTTNLTKEAFRERLGMRVIDRLRECGDAVDIKGESRRTQIGDF